MSGPSDAQRPLPNARWFEYRPADARGSRAEPPRSMETRRALARGQGVVGEESTLLARVGGVVGSSGRAQLRLIQATKPCFDQHWPHRATRARARAGERAGSTGRIRKRSATGVRWRAAIGNGSGRSRRKPGRSGSGSGILPSALQRCRRFSGGGVADAYLCALSSCNSSNRAWPASSRRARG
jgi:hypothetical protein